MRGRKPKPTEILKLTGAYRRDRHGDRDNAPQPTPAMPKRPPLVKGDARKVWDRLGPELVRLGLLTELDATTFTMYCLEWRIYLDACRQLQDAASCVTNTSHGNEIQHVLVGVRNRALANCLKIAESFGFTPSARTRLRVHVQDHEVDPLEELIARNKKAFFK